MFVVCMLKVTMSSTSSTKKTKRFKNSKQTKTYEDKLSQELAENIETLTHCGKRTLNLEEFKKTKNICKRSDKYVQEAHTMLMECLEENHAEVRLSAFQVCDELFRRSHCFRERVVFNLEQVVKLTTGASLPPPGSVARELRRTALRSIHQWNSKFGESYKKLALGYNYLRQVEKIDFDTLNVSDPAAHARQQENRRRKDAINGVRIKRVLTEIKDKELDIKTSAKSLSNGINLLLPHPDDFFILSDDEVSDIETKAVSLNSSEVYDSHSDSDEDVSDAVRREVGFLNPNHSVQLEFTPCSEANIEETEENAAIIESVREHARLIGNKYLPNVKAWLEVLAKSNGPEEEIRNLTELRGELEDVMFKYSRLAFHSTDDVSSDSDLEEVPSPPTTLSHQAGPAEPAEWTLLCPDTLSISGPQDPTSAQKRGSVSVKKEVSDEPVASTSSQAKSESTSTKLPVSDRKQKLLAVAPKLPFDVDLYHWEDEKLPVPTLIPSSTDGHRFWVGSENCIDELPLPGGESSLRTRVIEFTGNFTPVTHCCRARLPSGKLCPRRDRHKCPFHGEIVPRDDNGQCINPKDAMRMQALAEKRQQEKPDWQDPKLLAEIKKATGIDLKMPEKGKRKKKKKDYPGLTDLKQSENTATKRLERKIFKKSVMRKVASAMDKMDQRKFRDKFGDQFHYFYNS